MKKLVFVALLGLAFLGSCKAECEKYGTGTFKVQNLQQDPYEVWVDAIYEGSVTPYQTLTIIDLSAGTHNVYCEQESGYGIFGPTTYSFTTDILACQSTPVSLQ